MQAAVFAPGKLFVIGEYAVLEGGRALVGALDAGIRCSWDESDAWEIAAPDLGIRLRAQSTGELVELANGRSASALLAFAVRAGARDLAPASRLRLEVRASDPELGQKLGLGGSSAAAVSILAAFAAARGADLTDAGIRNDLFRSGVEVVRACQNPRASGADVAASVYGGWLAYVTSGRRTRIEPISLPAEFGLGAAWSGRRADTPASLARFAALAASTAGRAILDGLQVGLSRFWLALRALDRVEVLRSVSAYGARLAELARATNAAGGERIDELVLAARAAGVAAKGSGAVGGDCVIAVAFDRDALDEASARWRELEARVLDVRMDRGGVRVETNRA